MVPEVLAVKTIKNTYYYLTFPFFCIYNKPMEIQDKQFVVDYLKNPEKFRNDKRLEDPDVRILINKKINEKVTRALIAADEILCSLHNIANIDPIELFQDNGQIRKINEMTPEARKAIAGIEVEEIFGVVGTEYKPTGCIKKIKLWDKNRALENLAKHFKLISDKLEVDIGDNLAEELRAARQRAYKAGRTDFAEN